MAKRLINETIVLMRENAETKKMERIIPPIGKNFDLTADEIESIESVSDTAIGKADPDADTAKAADAADGSTDDGSDDAPAGTSTGTTAKDTKAKTSGGSGTAAKATPNKDDGDL